MRRTQRSKDTVNGWVHVTRAATQRTAAEQSGAGLGRDRSLPRSRDGALRQSRDYAYEGGDSELLCGWCGRSCGDLWEDCRSRCSLQHRRAADLLPKRTQLRNKSTPHEAALGGKVKLAVSLLSTVNSHTAHTCRPRSRHHCCASRLDIGTLISAWRSSLCLDPFVPVMPQHRVSSR